MTKPTAEEALAWLYEKGGHRFVDVDYMSARCQWARSMGWYETPLEAIRNAMKGESDGG